MDPSAQQMPNPMEQQLANSSQLGGGANGDHSKLNGDQVIVNPLSTQLRDQQQSQMAAQIAATNRAQAMVQSQVKQAQQIQQGLSKPNGSGTPPATAQSPQPNAQAAPQPPIPSGGAPAGQPVQNQQQPQASQVIQQPQPVQQPQVQQGATTQNSAPQGISPGTMQSPVSQNPAPQQQVQQGQPNGVVQSPQTQPGGGAQMNQQVASPLQNPAAQMPQGVVQQQPQMMQSQQPVQQTQAPQTQPGVMQNPVLPGTIQSPAAQQMQQPQQQTSVPQPVQFGQQPGTIQSPASQPQMVQQQSVQPVQPVQVASTFQNQQAVPQTAPVSFQNFDQPSGAVQNPAAPGAAQNGQDPNAAQAGADNQNTLSLQQAITDTFIPVAQLISSNHDPIQDLHHTVASSNVPDDLRVILNDRIKRLGQIKEGAGLSSMYILELESTTRYINACVGLPWVEKTEDTLDLSKAKEILDKHHYGLDLLKNRMLEFIASIMLNLKNNGPDFASRSPILCFVGLAGTGKTTFAKSMAEALGRQFERIPFGGMADSRALRGQSRYFPDAEPGHFIKSLARAHSKNPVVLLDEIDRVTETARADIMGVLIEALDPEQNAAFTDHYIDYPFSLQNCLFVATSNNISTIATAVLDRMEIIQMPNYNDEEKKVIGRDYVLPKVRKQMGLREDQLIIDESVWDAIIRPLGYDPGVRALDRIIGMICRRAARMIVAGEAENVRVTVNNMKPFVQDF